MEGSGTGTGFDSTIVRMSYPPSGSPAFMPRSGITVRCKASMLPEHSFQHLFENRPVVLRFYGRSYGFDDPRATRSLS